MKKAFVSIILVLLMILALFTGCKSDSTGTDGLNKSGTETLSSDANNQNNSDLSDASSSDVASAMSNYMESGWYCSNDIWCINGISRVDNKIGLCTHKYGEEETIISKNYSYYITTINEWIYFKARNADTDETSIKKIRISGSGEKTLVKPSSKDYDIDNMLIDDSKIYYTEFSDKNDKTTNSGLFRCDLDGKNKVTLIEKEVSNFYILNDKIYFINREDNHHLYVCDINGENLAVLIEDWVRSFVIDGNNIIYLGYKESMTDEKYEELEDSYKCVIKSFSVTDNSTKNILSGVNGFTSFLVDSEYIYYSNHNDFDRLYCASKDGKYNMVLSKDKYIESYQLLDKAIIYQHSSKKDEDSFIIEEIASIGKDGSGKTTLYK